MSLVAACCRRLLAALVLVSPAAALAQAPGPPAAAEAPSGPTLVISADLSPNATSNSQLRASLYEFVRRHGYSAAGKLDVDGVAASRSLMTAGSVTTDPAQLTELRLALDVAVLVRISKDSEDGGAIQARVAVVTRKGVHTEVVKIAGGGDTHPIEAALDRMLPAVLPPAPPPEQKPKLPPGTVGAIAPADVKPDDTLPARDAWEKRGGLRPAYGATVLVSGTQLRNVSYSGVNPGPPSRREFGQEDATGVGGGIGVRVGAMYLPIPEPNLSTGNFVAFRFGIGVDTNFFFLHRPTAFDYSGGARTTNWENRALWVSNGIGELGFAFAAGHFHSTSSWRGVLLGVAWAPALQFSMDMNGTSGEFRSNLAGLEANVDITKLDTAPDTDPDMQLRVFLWGLAPLDDDHPGMLSLGLGAIWY